MQTSASELTASDAEVLSALRVDSIVSTNSALALAQQRHNEWSSRLTVREYCNCAAKNIYACFCETVVSGAPAERPIDAELFFGAHLTDEPLDSLSHAQLQNFAQLYPFESTLLIKTLFRLPAVCNGSLRIEDGVLLRQDIWCLVDRFVRKQQLKKTAWWQRACSSGSSNDGSASGSAGPDLCDRLAAAICSWHKHNK